MTAAGAWLHDFSDTLTGRGSPAGRLGASSIPSFSSPGAEPWRPFGGIAIGLARFLPGLA
jgi:hypothetical protein